MLNQKSYSDRELIAIIREHDSLQKSRYTITKLDPPIQQGWRRSHVMTERALSRLDHSVLEEILKVIGQSVVHHGRDFRRRSGRSRKLVEIQQPLRPIPIHEWGHKKYPQSWFRYFRYELRLGRNRHWQPYWIFIDDSLYRLKIARNWIEQRREIDPSIESRLAEIEEWLESRQGWRRYGWLKGRRQSWYWNNRRYRLLERVHRREIANAYQNFPEVDPAASMRRIRTSFRINLHHFPRRSPMQRQRAQTSSSAGASPAAGTIFAPVAQRRGSGFKLRPVSVQIRPGVFMEREPDQRAGVLC